MIRRALMRFLVFAAVSVTLTWWIAGEIRGGDVGESYSLSSRFDDVAGLRAGDDVRLAGIPVGRVSSIEIDNGDAVVTVLVESDVDVPRDSAVAVRWRNLIGQRYVSIRPGTDTSLLAEGDEFTATDDVVDLGRLVNQLSPLAQAVGPDQVNRILTSLVVAFEGNEGTFDALTADMGSLAGVLAERGEMLGQMQADLATVSGAIASRDEQIAAMVGNMSTLSGTLDATDQLLETALAEFSRLAQGTESLLVRTTDDLTAILQQLPVITGTAVENLATIEEALRGMPPMLDAVLPTINRGPYLRVNVLCVAVGPGPCPHPLLFFEDEGA
ncbi:MAG: MlaD family protein [Acidimicrobiales bacterium]|nr:MlaD family protein [Acidimicrobiales bacterium]